MPDPFPVLCLGQSSLSIGSEIAKISDKFGFSNSNLAFVTDEILSNDGKSRLLKKCTHILSELNDYCSVCIGNRSSMFDIIQECLERADCASRIAVISDTYSQFGSWLSNLTLDYIKQEIPSSSIISVLVKPHLQYHGIENYYGLLASLASLDIADCSIFRGHEQCCQFTSQTRGAGDKSTNIYSNEHIACDLWPALMPLCNLSDSNNAQILLWPLGISSNTGSSKLIDIRSSLYAMLKNLSKYTNKLSSGEGSAAQRGDANNNKSLRILATNVNQLHVFYKDRYPNVFYDMSTSSTSHQSSAAASTTRSIINSASYMNMLLPMERRRYKQQTLQFLPQQHSDQEVAASFARATQQSIVWPFTSSSNHNTSLYSSNHNSNTMYDGIAADAYETSSLISTSSSTILSGNNMLSRRSSNNNSSNNSSNSFLSRSSANDSVLLYNTDAENQKLHTIASVLFQSPYAVQDLRHLTLSTEKLLSIGAYRHL